MCVCLWIGIEREFVRDLLAVGQGIVLFGEPRKEMLSILIPWVGIECI